MNACITCFPEFCEECFGNICSDTQKWHIIKWENVAITSLSTIGRINGWFIHKSVHPVSFGIGSLIKKAVVKNDEIKIREILNMTILFDHDVIDGAPMVRFLNDLTAYIENGEDL